jgi:hypothetical protein
MQLTRDALALLDIPRAHAATLPGFGWRPRRKVGLKSTLMLGLLWMYGKVEREEWLEVLPASWELGVNPTLGSLIL